MLATYETKEQAEARAKEAAKQSISAGVLHGADYTGFGKADWVAFMGQYDSQKAAVRAGKGYAAKGFRGEPRRIKPKK